jgi:hypothetical protein
VGSRPLSAVVEHLRQTCAAPPDRALLERFAAGRDEAVASGEFVTVPVPEGKDGQVWSLSPRAHGQLGSSTPRT